MCVQRACTVVWMHCFQSTMSIVGVCGSICYGMFSIHKNTADCFQFSVALMLYVHIFIDFMFTCALVGCSVLEHDIYPCNGVDCHGNRYQC